VMPRRRSYTSRTMRKPVGLRLVGAVLGMVLASVAFGGEPTFMPAPVPGARRVPPPKGDVPPSVDADEPTTPTTGLPPTPPTTGQPPTDPTTETGPVTIFG